MVALVAAAVEEASAPPRREGEAQTFVNARSEVGDGTQAEEDSPAGIQQDLKKARSLF